MEQMELIKQGAEAKLYICDYLGMTVLVKERFKKRYRHMSLDSALSIQRIKNESRSIVRCKAIGVKTPTLYLVDLERRRIYMQYFRESITIKDFIINMVSKNENVDIDVNSSLDVVLKLIGENVRKMHDNNIIHGDLTTSNILLVPKRDFTIDGDISKWFEVDNLEIVMIDFGLSFVDESTEDKGVDLYVLERALISTHNDYLDLFEKILTAYKYFNRKNVKEIMSKFEEVRARGRKRTMVG